MATHIAPTLACADLLHLGDVVSLLDRIGIDSYHMDVMDGNFVPNYCMSWDVVRQLKAVTRTPVDIHLMVRNIDRDIDIALALGCEAIAFHVEQEGDIMSRIDRIHQEHSLAGIAVSPGTSLSVVRPWLDQVDYVLVMGVKPGFSGQKFMDQTLGRIASLVRERGERRFSVWVDGGVDEQNGMECRNSGADVLIAGKLCVFKDWGKVEENTVMFKKLVE